MDDGSGLLPSAAALAIRPNRTASQARSRGAHVQLLAYPRLQNASRMSRDGVWFSWPGAVQYPAHPQPNGSRDGCGHVPPSIFSIGMKYGQAKTQSPQRNFLGPAIVIS